MKPYRTMGVLLIGLFTFLLQTNTVNAATVDLKSYYPNPQLFENYYLEGMNHRDPNEEPSRSVLWFEATGDNGDSFRLYNSGPEDIQNRCNWDQLSWVGDYLTYSQTHHECNGNDKDVIYDAPIRFLPRYWDDTAPWSYNGSSSVTTTTLSGDPGCTGTNNYTGEIVGYVELQPGVQAIHWRTTQVTEWASGNDAPYCVAGGTTNWVENYYLIANLPVEDYAGLTAAPALARSVGGNTDAYDDTGLWDWDIWFSRWVLLPWADPLSVPADSQNQSTVPGPPQAGMQNEGHVYLIGISLLFVVAVLFYRFYASTK